VSALPVLAKALGVGMEELLGESTAATRKRGPATKLQQHMDRISQLPKPQQRFVIQVLESVLAQHCLTTILFLKLFEYVRLA
jgi:hypothetical protein